MKKTILIILMVAIIVLVIILVLRVFSGGGGDGWIKDNRGVWVKRGQPTKVPPNVLAQQELIQKAMTLYQNQKASGIDFSQGPCLGKISDNWVVDIAHSPRQAIDNLPENQCADFRTGQAHHFIELTPTAEIIKIY